MRGCFPFDYEVSLNFFPALSFHFIRLFHFNPASIANAWRKSWAPLIFHNKRKQFSNLQMGLRKTKKENI